MRVLRLVSGLLLLIVLGCQTVPAAVQAEDGRNFPQTGYAVRGEFLRYWETNGGLALFGYPVSGELWEDGRTVQYFERNRFELHPDNPANSQVLRVSDDGIGIPTAELPNIFTRFYRTSNASTNTFTGMGIGLYVSQELVTRHGGTIAVVSAEGMGATFTVRLPLVAE